jgi:hypothetical protein
VLGGLILGGRIMRWTSRLAIASVAAASVATVVGFAAPASAAYSKNPIALPWTPSGAVHASVAGNGVLYLGGKLDGTGGIAAIDAGTGNLLWQVPADNDVRALALSPDGSTLYAGGSFTAVAGVTHKHLVALNVADHSLLATWKAKAAGQVRDLLVHGSDVYVAGKITSVDGVAQRGIGAVDATTGLRDTSFGISADNDVLGLALAGTRLVMSGSFTHVNGAARNLLASVDLTTNTLTSWAPAKLCTGCDQYWDVATDGTNAYVGTSGNSAAAFNLTTGARTWRVTSDGDFQTVWLAGDGELYLGGHFAQQIQSGTTVVPVTVVAAVFAATGQIDSSFTPKIYKTYPGCWAIQSTPGKLWIGGDFTGELANGTNNHKPYLAAYPVI